MDVTVMSPEPDEARAPELKEEAKRNVAARIRKPLHRLRLTACQAEEGCSPGRED